MCELFAMSASRPIVVKYELDRFAAEGGERHRNRDGWGIVFAEDRDAHVFREATPAADSKLARMVVRREIPCRHLLAHVRRASRGRQDLANTHPFTRTRGGHPHHFAHNGNLHGIDEMAPGLREECVGDTDSELAFMLLLKELSDLPNDDQATPERFKRFADFAARMAALGPANFLFFDGRTLFAHAHERVYEIAEGLTPPKPPGLQVRHFAREPRYGRWRARGARIPDLPHRTILLASVPLNEDGWAPLPKGHAMAIRDGELLHEAATL